MYDAVATPVIPPAGHSFPGVIAEMIHVSQQGQKLLLALFIYVSLFQTCEG